MKRAIILLVLIIILVTGGILFKINEAIRIVNEGIDVYFSRAGTNDAVQSCLGISLKIEFI
jgi:hypothetical protein